MPSNEDRVWRYVANNWRSFQENAPAGYEAIVEVFIAGRAEPLLLTRAQSRADLAWALLVSSPSGGNAPSADDSLVFVTEPRVERIEIRYRPTTSTPRRVGFSSAPMDDLET